MAGILNLCEKYYGTKNLYEVLNVNKDADEKEVKKAYYKLSLSIHPDRVAEEEKLLATEKFQVLSQVHSILTDDTKRKTYDQTGRVDDDSEEASFDNWVDYWQQLFKTISIEDIENHEKIYKGSEQERNDLKQAYLRGRGCWNIIHEFVPFLNCDDEPRVMEILKELVDAKEVPKYNIFFNEPKAKRNRRHIKYEREAKSVENITGKRKKKGDGEILVGLVALLNHNNAARSETFLDSLTEKYASEATNQTKKGKAKAKAKAKKRLSSTPKK